MSNRTTDASNRQIASHERREQSGPVPIGELLEVILRRIEEQAARRRKRHSRRRRAA